MDLACIYSESMFDCCTIDIPVVYIDKTPPMNTPKSLTWLKANRKLKIDFYCKNILVLPF